MAIDILDILEAAPPFASGPPVAIKRSIFAGKKIVVRDFSLEDTIDAYYEEAERRQQEMEVLLLL